MPASFSARRISGRRRVSVGGSDQDVAPPLVVRLAHTHVVRYDVHELTHPVLAQGARDNHWLRLRLAGLPQRELIGSKLRLRDGSGKLLGRRDLFPVTSYKTSVHLESHFGLGHETRPRLEVELPSGRKLDVGKLPIDAVVEVDVRDGRTRIIRAATRQLDTAEASP